MNIQTDRAFVPAGSPSIRYLTITISVPARPRRAERPAVEVALVLDRSGSMAGSKLENARKAVEHAVRLLDKRDRLAVVCYDTEIDTLLGATAATPEAKTLALSRLGNIDARGSTDLCGGWLRGAEELETAADAETRDASGSSSEGTLSRVLLLSDGLANHGETDSDLLASHAVRLRSRGIATSTFGLGADFDEQLMSRLATQGGGHFYFIEQPAQIPDFLTSELGDALEVVARDARLIVGGAAGVQAACFNDFPVEAGANPADGLAELHVRLGDLVSEQELTVTIGVSCPALAAGDIAQVSVRLADRDHALYPQPMPVEWRVVDDGAHAAQPVNADVIVHVATVLAERARGAALELNRRGDYSGATALLKSVAADVRTLGGGNRRVEAIAAELEADEHRYAVVMEAMEMKQAHFASYSASRGRSSEGKATRSRPRS